MTRAPHILVIDDTEPNRKLMDAVLSPHGYAVAGAASGREGLAMIAAEQPDLVLLDIVMPEMNGYEVCRALEDPATQLLPIIMLTSSGDEDKVKAIEAGADDFIARPVNQPELLARVRSLLRIKEYHDTIQAQAAELAEWKRSLESRVSAQVDELERLSRLRRSCRRSSRTSSSAAKTRPCSPAIGARSPLSSATCAALPRSRRRPSPRR